MGWRGTIQVTLEVTAVYEFDDQALVASDQIQAERAAFDMAHDAIKEGTAPGLLEVEELGTEVVEHIGG